MTQWPDKEGQKTIYNNVSGDASPDRYYFGMVILSCTVATYGLLSNSTAVVIGAMLIAPLMGPILGGALAVATNSNPLLKMSAKAEALGAVTAVVLAALLTLVLPSAELTPEVLARTTPTILDLVVALASGAAGTYAMCVKPQGATLPGVAIATALMPPLCVVGIGLAKQNFSVVSGAFLLFLANMIAINVAAIAMFELAGFSRDSCHDGTCKTGDAKKTTYRMLYPVVLLIVISIPLAFIMYKTYSHANIEKVIKTSLIESLEAIAPHSTLISTDYREQDNRYQVDAAFRTTKIIMPENIRQMENLLELRLGKPVGVSADVVLVQKVNDKTNIDTFQALLPKVKEKEIVEVVRSSTPEEVIDSVLQEKLALLPNSKLEDYTLEYRKGEGTYKVTVKISSASPVDDKLSKTIQNILEERLKRRVEVNIESKAIQNNPAAPQKSNGSLLYEEPK
ncbi:hypothetical protein SOV_28860 [Sporomusa ovata DSM 2662]|uniref:Putative integral membrane protein n=1 Tax=Sporomusa ovata TaxID=2378 RepID=A0A0U1L1H3_9FIRM|nr:TIGR00341 family protein [Sporomusa ovata]EQB24586.1 hypothetical protein SOV_7c00700 [Sporomusa ovata DSM 2662]CQR73527.1 putative integral membrane protein [Sporomusa ovata]